MQSDCDSNEIFSFHLLRLPFFEGVRFLFAGLAKRNFPGLKHSEFFITMNLGEPVFSPARYNFRAFGFFALWESEASLDNFLLKPSYPFSDHGWHVRMRLYRKWGEIDALKDVVVGSRDPARVESPIVAVTLARLNLSQTFRFIRWGKPVEKQVRDHNAQLHALAAIRPPNTFSTFSVWKSEAAMIGMVYGKDASSSEQSHALAMKERNRKDFHHQFSTMRFQPISEFGTWKEKSGHTATT